jgi:uncharacterized protein (UPF0332 family)
LSSPKQEVIRYRLDQAREALDDAQYNLDGGRVRAASNRVYYAMFYAAVALLATRDLSSSRHSGVIALFHEHFVKSGAFPRALAHTLGQALDMRTDTDYKVSVLPEPAKLAKMLESARAFVRKAEDLVRAA